MKVLVACEYSGIVSRAFAAKGHDVTSCDLLPTEYDFFTPLTYKHYQGDVLEIIEQGFDLCIGHPPCTYLSYAGTAHWNKPGRKEQREQALEFFKKLYDMPAGKVCLENPLGYAATWRKYDQIIHPYHFGDPYHKRTCLWLKGLKPLVHTNVVKPVVQTYSTGRRRYCTDVLRGTKDERAKQRARFWPGIAAAMAEQWG